MPEDINSKDPNVAAKIQARTVQLLCVDGIEVHLLDCNDFATFDVQTLVHLHNAKQRGLRL